MLELIGIGTGMFNLGLAAMLDDAGVKNALFLDRKDRFRWHDGILTDVSYYQDDHLSDLVTLANPTSRFTFLSYLKTRKLLYQYATRLTAPVLRTIWEDYFRWVSEELTTVRWNQEVERVDFVGDHFEIATTTGSFASKHISIGVGTEPRLPELAHPVNDDRVYHSSAYSAARRDLTGKRVCVVGGSQSGAEIVDDILNRFDIGNLIWISSTPYHMSKDPALYLFDIWNPSIYRETYGLKQAPRNKVTDAMSSTQTAISMSTMSSIYAKLFDRKFYTRKGFDPVVVSNNRVADIRCGKTGIEVYSNDESTDRRYRFEADEVILATGYKRNATRLIGDIVKRYDLSTEDLNFNHSVKWGRSGRNDIFIRNNGSSRFGVMEGNAFIQPYVSSLIVNSIVGREVYDEHPDSSIQKYTHDLSRYAVE